MDELVKINYENQRPTVLGRDLHEALEVKTAYKDWFPRMCEYGFEEGSDFFSFLSESTGGRPKRLLTMRLLRKSMKSLRSYMLREGNPPRPSKKNEPTLADKIAIAQKYIQQGNCISLVLRLVIHVHKMESRLAMNRFVNGSWNCWPTSTHRL
ncbi:antA/AntB antirepressor family protein, partial [Paenibacillus larvae]